MTKNINKKNLVKALREYLAENKSDMTREEASGFRTAIAVAKGYSEVELAEAPAKKARKSKKATKARTPRKARKAKTEEAPKKAKKAKKPSSKQNRKAARAAKAE